MSSQQENSTPSTKQETNWIFVICHLHLYVSLICALHFAIYDAYWTTIFFSIFLVSLGILGVTAGSHRLWAHRSYEATTSLKIFLMLCQTLAGHGSIYDWVKYHRLHHKYFNTDLDPFNPAKGFVYAHFIAPNMKLSPAQEKALEEIDMSDIEKDSVVMFQKKFYYAFFIIVTFLLPINAPAEYWGETILNSTFIAGWLRYACLLHLSWLVHSATRIWDLNAREKNPPDSNLVFFITKSHWLSYHYLVPFDYQTGEYGQYGTDCTTKFIRVCAALEYATNLKSCSSQTVRDALSLSLVENKPIQECLLQLHTNANNAPDENFLKDKLHIS